MNARKLRSRRLLWLGFFLTLAVGLPSLALADESACLGIDPRPALTRANAGLLGGLSRR